MENRAGSLERANPNRAREASAAGGEGFHASDSRETFATRRREPGLGGKTNEASQARLPERVCASAAGGRGEYDARRLRSQRDLIRDVMLAAADCETWLTLAELRALTRYGEASISAQLRHLRKPENGGYDVVKRRREGAAPVRPGADGRGESVWEYRIARAGDGFQAHHAEARARAVSA